MRVKTFMLPPGRIRSIRDYFKLTKVRSTNQDCAGTKPCTFLLKARGLRLWTMKSHGGLSTSRSCASLKDFRIAASSVASASVLRAVSNFSSFYCWKLEPVGEELAAAK